MSIVTAIEAEFRRYKALADSAIAQLRDEELARPGPGGGNSVEILIRHIAGNFASRFTDFRTSDGEKPWRHRDDEFEPAAATRQELIDKWESAWRIVFSEVAKLSDAALAETVTVRGQPLRIDEALLRSLAHTAYHAGQIVYLAKAIRAEEWRCLSIPKGMSEEYNRMAPRENAAAHAAWLASQGRTTT
jgi:uncharacterized damage-inducible protein DinB